MMIYKTLNKFYKALHVLSNKQTCFIRKFSSALYITGDKAQKTFAVLTPVIDFEKQLENRDLLVRNLNARKLPIDLEKLEKRWQFFQSINDRKNVLDLTRIEIGRLISELMKDEEKNKSEIETLKLHSKLVKDDFKNVKEYFYGLEEDTMLQILNLPNALHEKTPLEAVTVYEHLDCLKEKPKSHMEIGEKRGYIEYVDPFACYFKSDAALFEMGILNYFRHNLLESGFSQFSNPNFCRSVIVEGCGENNKDSPKVFTLEEKEESEHGLNRLHLCGTGSLHTFMAYFTKHLVHSQFFPLRYFSFGKKYQPVNDIQPRDLFNLCQDSVLNIFVATLEEHDLLEEIKKQVIALYNHLGYHFKLVLLAASELEKSECLRLSIQMHSNYLETYIEVGNVSLYDNYLSKRLLFAYNLNKERKYPKVIAGTLVNVPKLLGCVLENNAVSEKDLMSTLVKKHLFV